MRFKALINFKSKEFSGSQYVAGLSYTVRDGNTKLQDMVAKWTTAKLFKANADLEFFGEKIEKGSTSYHINDDFKPVVDLWVASGKADYIPGSLISVLNIDNSNNLGVR